MQAVTLDPENFLHQVDDLIKSRNYFVHHPIVKDLISGKLPKKHLQEWVKQNHYDFEMTSPYMAYVYAKCTDAEVRKIILDVMLEEEGITPTYGVNLAARHGKLFLEFGVSIGISESQIKNAKHWPETEVHALSYDTLLRESTFPEALAILYAGESLTMQNYTPIIEALKKYYDVDKNGLKYWAAHVVGDEEHSDLIGRIIKKYGTSSEAQKRMLDAINQYFKIYLGWWDALYHRMLVELPPVK